MVDYKELDETHKIVTAGHHTPESMGTAIITGSVTDRNEHRVELLGTIVPGLGQHLFSVSAAASMDAVAVSDVAKPRLEIGTGTIPLQRLRDTNQLYFFSLTLDIDGTYRASGWRPLTSCTAAWDTSIRGIWRF